MRKSEDLILAAFGRMYVLVTIEALYYNGPLRTYSTHYRAWLAGCAHGGWYDIERIL